MTDSKPILIIGAGVSGLCLAAGLRKNTALKFRIFERDPSLHARSQGYRVRVSGEGISSLKHNLGEEGYARLIANGCAYVHDGSTHNSIDSIVDGLTGGEGHLDNVWSAADGKAKVHQHLGGEEDKPLAVDRSVLRQVMFEQVSDLVEFNKKLLSYELTNEGLVSAKFDDGTTVTGIALIGCDGCFSHARGSLLPDYVLKDSEARVIWGKAKLSDDFVAALPSLARNGLGLFTTPELKVLFEAMRFDRSAPHVDEKLVPDDYYYYLCYPRSDHLAQYMTDAEFLKLTNDEAGELAKKLTETWSENAQVPFQRVSPHAASVSRIPTATPDIPVWDEKGPVTLMGDAVHSMAPTAALGATTALRDSWHLGRQLEKLPADVSTESMTQALRQYEQEMRVYAAQALELSAQGGKVVFGFRGFESVPAIKIHH